MIKYEKEYGQLTIISDIYYIIKSNKKRPYVKCLCICGKEKEICLESLKTGNTKTCGCSHKLGSNITHGKSKHPLYLTYKNIKSRCYNSKNEFYYCYGERGISVCQEWLDDFMNFYNWAINNGWQKGLTIERKNNDGNYNPENCKWIPLVEQAKNKSTIHKITVFNETKSITEWGQDYRCKVNAKILFDRIRWNWNPEEAITTPKLR